VHHFLVPIDPCAELATSSLFKGAAAKDFEPLRSHIRHRTYSRGEYLWHAGEPALSVHLILAGEITTARVGPDGEEYLLEVYLAHDIVGQLPMLDDRPVRLLHAMAAASTSCLDFPLLQLRRLVELKPQLLLPLTATYSQWIRLRDAHASEAAFQNLAAKVACKLLELHLLTHTRAGDPIALDLPQGRLAGMLGASRENVNRALARLLDRGEVVRSGRHLTITDPDELLHRYSWAAASDNPVFLARTR
jgi:CRP/FNR family transcriptional regulator, cyclic AMP receptor protein